MEILNKKTLTLLTLLMLIGLLTIPYCYNTKFVIISYLFCLVGGISFGTLLAKK